VTGEVVQLRPLPIGFSRGLCDLGGHESLSRATGRERVRTQDALRVTSSTPEQDAAADPASDWCTSSSSLRSGRRGEGEPAGGVQPGTTLSLRLPG